MKWESSRTSVYFKFKACGLVNLGFMRHRKLPLECRVCRNIGKNNTLNIITKYISCSVCRVCHHLYAFVYAFVFRHNPRFRSHSSISFFLLKYCRTHQLLILASFTIDSKLFTHCRFNPLNQGELSSFSL